MRIINPAFGLQSEAVQETRGAGSAGTDWTRDPIAIFSNAKPNALELLQGLRQKMGAFRRIDDIVYHCKDSAAQPAPPDLIDTVSQNYRGAILALAD